MLVGFAFQTLNPVRCKIVLEVIILKSTVKGRQVAVGSVLLPLGKMSGGVNEKLRYILAAVVSCYIDEVENNYYKLVS